MKAVFLLEPGKLEIREIAKPVPGRGEVLVKVAYCGLCTLEQRLFHGDMKIFYPIIPGHEVSGIIESVGSGVTEKIKPGMKAAVDMIYRCHECYYCRTGQSNLCENRFAAHVSPLGGFAEYIAVKAEQVFPLEEDIQLKYAALSEPAACCIRSLKKTGLSLAEDIHIAGAGPMGMLHILIAGAMGARVTVSDIDKSRLKIAQAVGADFTINADEEDAAERVKSITGGRGADVCIVTSPAKAALDTAFASVRNNGRINIFTAYMGESPECPVDAEYIHRRGIIVTGTEGRTEADFQQAVRLLSFSRINVKPVISSIFNFEEVYKGMAAAVSRDTQRVLLKFS